MRTEAPPGIHMPKDHEVTHNLNRAEDTIASNYGGFFEQERQEHEHSLESVHAIDHQMIAATFAQLLESQWEGFPESAQAFYESGRQFQETEQSLSMLEHEILENATREDVQVIQRVRENIHHEIVTYLAVMHQAIETSEERGISEKEDDEKR